MRKRKITIIGLGYVGLPLARLFATRYNVVGFDINNERVNELKEGVDSTLEINSDLLKSVLKERVSEKNGLYCTSSVEDIKDSTCYIVTVPTPVNDENIPVLTPLFLASKTVGGVLKINDIVIFESTVYPGATENDCVPILEKTSGLIFNKDFFVGYSPERINPGDREHTVDKILKVTSGSNKAVAYEIDKLYNSVITAGTYLASSIKVAEAAKVIENSQRDINIAFVNELAKIFDLLEIDTDEVLKAASTKWNFLPFKPGLVGGHCIGVDPYYLAQKSIELGYHPEIILSGRKLNDSMGEYIGNRIIEIMISKKIDLSQSNILVLGVTFKENCPDTRNTKVVDLIYSLKKRIDNISIYDPWACRDEFKKEYNIDLQMELNNNKFDVIVLAVSHKEFLNLNYDSLKSENSFIYDIKSFLDKNISDYRL